MKNLKKKSNRKETTSISPSADIMFDLSDAEPIQNKEETMESLYLSEHIKFQNEPLYGKTFAVKDTYLPNVLVKLGFFENNSLARKFIREEGILLNGKLCKDSDATNGSTNFEIVFYGSKIQIFKQD